MRKAFIALGIVLFLIYCWASVVYQNRVDIPDYRLVDVDLLGGVTRARWDASPQSRFQRLMELETLRYQLPEDARIAAGDKTRSDADRLLPVDRPLTGGDFAHLIASAPAGEGVVVRLRDAGAIYALVNRNYLLRDNIEDPGYRDGPPLYVGGRAVDKDMLDALRARGLRTITVTGHGAPVSFQTGTAIMVAIIFLTLVAALKPILWDPFLAMLEKRVRELEIGAEAERQNQAEAIRYEEESRRRNDSLYRSLQELRMGEERETARQAGDIVNAARDGEKRFKEDGLRELGASAREAEARLREELPALAEAVAEALTPGRGGTRWDRLGDRGEK